MVDKRKPKKRNVRGDGTTKKGRRKGAGEATQVARDAEALQLRRRGMTWKEIGKAIGIDKSNACRAYSRARARLMEAADIDAAAIREEQTGALFESLERQEEILERLREMAEAEGAEAADLLVAAEQLRKTEETYGRTWERMGKLWGANAPTEVKFDVSDVEAARERIEEALRRRREAKDDAAGSRSAART